MTVPPTPTPVLVPADPPASTVPLWRRELTSLGAWSAVHSLFTGIAVALLVGFIAGKLL